MKTLVKTLLLIMLLTSTGCPVTDPDPFPEPENLLVNRVDHVVFFYNTMNKVDSAFSFFHSVLELPAWFKPEVRRPIIPAGNSFYSGVVYMGNVFIEFITYNVNSPGGQVGSISPYYYGMAFSNLLANDSEILDMKDIEYETPYDFAFKDQEGNTDTLFTNYIMFRDEMLIFLCDYHKKLFSHPDFYSESAQGCTDIEEVHATLEELCGDCNGGRLGIERVERFVLATNDFEFTSMFFDSLTVKEVQQNSGEWILPGGPALELVQDDIQVGIGPKKMIVKVNSLLAAREFMDAESIEYIVLENCLELVSISNILGCDIILKDF